MYRVVQYEGLEVKNVGSEGMGVVEGMATSFKDSGGTYVDVLAIRRLVHEIVLLNATFLGVMKYILRGFNIARKRGGRRLTELRPELDRSLIGLS